MITLLAWSGFERAELRTLECGIWVHMLLFLAVALHCLLRPRDPRSTLAWIFFVWVAPLMGAFIYLLFGINRVREKGWQKHESDQTFYSNRNLREQEERPLSYWRGIRAGLLTEPVDAGALKLNAFLNRLAPNHPLLGGNDVRILVGAREAYPDMLAAIRGARRHIHLQSYIIGADVTGRELMDALAERAAAGVEVRVLFDEFGSAHARMHRFFRRYARLPRLQIVGFSQANLYKRQFQINLRNHRKILVVDGSTGYTGGINFYDVYRPSDNTLPTHDYHFRVTGPIVLELQYTFLRDWYYMTDEAPEKLLAPEFFPKTLPAGQTPMRLLNNGPTATESDNLLDAIFAAISGARRQVLIVTPYFVPPPEIQRALRCAALRGVEVKVLVPSCNNHRYVGYASQALYDNLLESGVRIFEQPPPFLHAKALLVDDCIAIIGSANLDARSLRLNYESDLVVLDERFGSVIKRVMLNDFALGHEVLLANWRTRPLCQRLTENLCSLLSPIA
ncbi:MAG: cardiolipin synthase [Kiritimatiellia bacterium]